jgi:Glu-tRNA(Gln) amidotransferase subunit E-like FAD-binding protein
VAELVRRETLRQGRLGRLVETFVRAGNRGGKDPVADVAGVLSAASECREDVVVRLKARLSGLVGGEIVSERRQQFDRPHTCLGL